MTAKYGIYFPFSLQMRGNIHPFGAECEVVSEPQRPLVGTLYSIDVYGLHLRPSKGKFDETMSIKFLRFTLF